VDFPTPTADGAIGGISRDLNGALSFVANFGNEIGNVCLAADQQAKRAVP
jgi:hypothetical protein